MNLFDTYEHLMRVELERMVSAGELTPVDFARLTVEPTRDPAHGDIATNAALIAAGRMDVAEFAHILSRHFIALPDVVAAEVAENGFLNLRLKPVVWQRVIIGILHSGGDRDVCTGVNYESAADWSVNDPVFDVTHVLAICCSVLKYARGLKKYVLDDAALANCKLSRLTSQSELALMKSLTSIQFASRRGETKQIKLYLQAIANSFRAAWASGSDDKVMGFLDPKDSELSMARLALVRASALVIAGASG